MIVTYQLQISVPFDIRANRFIIQFLNYMETQLTEQKKLPLLFF